MTKTEPETPKLPEGFGASYNREIDAWTLYTMPGSKRIGAIDGHNAKALVGWICDALNAGLRPTPTPAPIDSSVAERIEEVAPGFRDALRGASAPGESALADELEKALPLLEDLETGQDCEEYAFATGKGFQAMTYCPAAFEALRCIPDVLAALRRTPPQSGEVSQEQVEAGKRLREHLEWDRETHASSGNDAEVDELNDLLADLALLNPPPPPSVEVGLADLRAKLRNVISHATGGHLSDHADLGLNDICVEISRHRNLIWEEAKKSALRQQPIGVVEDGVVGRLRQMADEDEHWDNHDLAATHRLIAAEITRYREALGQIASCDSHHPSDVVAIARKALSSPTDTKGDA